MRGLTAQVATALPLPPAMLWSYVARAAGALGVITTARRAVAEVGGPSCLFRMCAFARHSPS